MTALALIRGTIARRRTGLTARLSQALALHRQRHVLATLPDAMLDDIGVTRAKAEAEAARPVWDVPAGWRR